MADFWPTFLQIWKYWGAWRSPLAHPCSRLVLYESKEILARYFSSLCGNFHFFITRIHCSLTLSSLPKDKFNFYRSWHTSYYDELWSRGLFGQWPRIDSYRTNIWNIFSMFTFVFIIVIRSNTSLLYKHIFHSIAIFIGLKNHRYLIDNIKLSYEDMKGYYKYY